MSPASSRRGPLAPALLSLCIAGSLQCLAIAPAAAQSQASAAQASFDIPAQPLIEALRLYSRQSGQQVLFNSGIGAGRTGSVVRGRLSHEQALRQLLVGTGLRARRDAAGNFQLEALPEPAAEDGVIRTGALNVEGGVIDGASTASESPDRFFRSAQSGAQLDRQRIQAFRGTSVGDFIKGEPGVLTGDNRNSGALDVNIRGMQGQGRVPVIIDGATQQTDVYRGYAGSASRSYLDPDLIGGVTIEKGPSAAADAVGATGGVVRMRTLGAQDLIDEGGQWGLQVKVGSYGNNVGEPAIGTVGTGQGTAARYARPNDLTFHNGSLSAAWAQRFGNLELVAALAKRRVGNYFAGEHGKGPTGEEVGYQFGEEVLNTSQDSTSGLLRGVLHFADGQTLDLSWTRYESDFGEMMPSAIFRGGQAQQGRLSRVEVDTATARYRWNPADNDLIDLKADLWGSDNHTDIETLYRFTGAAAWVKDVPYIGDARRWGLNIANTSSLDTGWGPLELSYGASHSYERLQPSPEWWRKKAAAANNPDKDFNGTPRDGSRRENSAFFAAELMPRDWLTLSASLRYLDAKAQDNIATEILNTWPKQTAFNHEHASGWAPILSVLVEPVQGLQFYVRHAQALRAPSLFESTGYGQGISYRPNPFARLKAEHARNSEIGINLETDSLFTDGDRFQAKLAWFNQRIDDYITRGTRDLIGFTMENIDQALFRGFELSSRYDTGRLFVEASGSWYTHREFCDAGKCWGGGSPSGYVQSHVPPRTGATLNLGGHWLDGRLTAGARFTHTGDRAAMEMPIGSTITTVDWSPYNLVDLFGSYRINDRLSVDAAIDNVGDRYYMDALTLGLMPSPGRTVRLSLTGRFGDGTPATLRSFGAGAEGRASAFEPFNGDWSGFYLAGLVGQTEQRLRGRSTSLTGVGDDKAARESANLDIADIRHGLRLGHNWQLSSGWVLGVEGGLSDGNVSWSNEKSYQQTEAREASGWLSTPLQARMRHELGLGASLGGRIGYSFGRTLVYGMASINAQRERQTRTQYKASNTSAGLPNGSDPRPAFAESASNTRLGWSLGVGTEVALGNRWALRAEYAYADLGRDSFRFNDAREAVAGDYVRSDLVEMKQCYWEEFDFWYDCPVYRDTTVPGAYNNANGRQARDRLTTQTLSIGLTWRF